MFPPWLDFSRISVTFPKPIPPRPMLVFCAIRLLIMAIIGDSASSDICQSQQYLKLGEKGVINCNFPDDFYGVYWYDKANVSSDVNPIASLREGVKFGLGYMSGEHDVHPNGSLILRNVLIQHDHVFGVTILESRQQDPLYEVVRVIVFDEPHEPYPTITVTGCELEKICFLKLNASTNLHCTVVRVGEVLDDLSWMLRTRDRDEKIPSQSIHAATSDSELSSYYATVNVAVNTSLALSLFICISRSHVPEVGSSESIILIDHGTSQSPNEPTILFATPKETVVMDCGGSDVVSLLWKQVNKIETIIAFSATNIVGQRITKVTGDGFILKNNNSLIISVAENHTLGNYTCVFSSDGVTAKSKSYEVTFDHNVTQQRTGLIGLIVAVLVIVVVIIIVMLSLTTYKRRFSGDGPASVSLTSIFNMCCSLIKSKRQDSGTETEVSLESIEKNTSDELNAWCSKDVTIDVNDTQDIRAKTFEMLKKASETGTIIKRVILHNSFRSVNDGGTDIYLNCGEALPAINMLTRLDFENTNWYKLQAAEFSNIMHCVSHSMPLQVIKFVRYLLPFEPGDGLKMLERKPLVEWETGVATAGVLNFDFETRKWKSAMGGLTSDAYEDIVKKAEGKQI